MGKTYAEWLVRWRYLILVATLALVAGIGSGARFITFDTDYRVFFSEDNPQLQAFEELQNTYTKTDNVMFVLAPKDGEVFSPETLNAIARLTEESWQIPYSLRVDSITNYQHTEARDDDLLVDDLVPEDVLDALDEAAIQRIRNIALNEPLLVDHLISARGHVTGVNVTIQLPDDTSGKEVPSVAAFSRDLAEKARAENPHLDIYLTGMVMMNNSFPEVSIHDQQTLVPLMFGIIILTLILLLRSFVATVGTFMIIIFSIAAAMGIAGWLGIALTPPSASAPTIIMTLAVADCVHILVTFLHAMRRGLDKRAAMVESIRINLQPVFLTTLTTVIGFLSMNFSDAPPFRDLGNIVAMGVAAAFIFSVSFLPALMLVLPVRVKPVSTGSARRVDRFAELVIARRNPLFWGMGILVVALVSFLPRNELNDEFIKYFDETVDFRTATEFTTSNLTGLYTVDYSLGNGETGGVNDPEFLHDVERFAQWFRTQKNVLHVTTLTDIMKRLNKNMHADDPDWYRLPEERELAAQYLLLYEMSLPYGLDLTNRIDISKSSTKLTVFLQSLSSNELLAMEGRAQQWLAENAPHLQSAGASPAVMFAYIGQRNIISMLIGTSIALVLISLILVFALRSVKIGLISLIPNMAPAAMGFGLWGLLYGQVGLGLSIVAGLTLGIVVDDTVHFLSKYLRARREQGMNSQDAVRYAFHTVGVALLVTTIVLVAGFLVLAQSSFKLNSDMGLLTSITIALALLADFLFLPPLLMKLDR
ncbi:MAG: MMPL family transporter [Gammaproteobacteria bacterium]|nr:MMPL family transporter [Gammaproteobacteria bacterium]MDH3984793.1 MMPL family transporter [Gammaproteobacteria bacterium]